MHRRTLLRASAATGLLALAGCLGLRDGGRSVEGTADDREPVDPSDIDPDAHYVRDSPEGPFSAKGRWNTDLDGVAIHGLDVVAYHRGVGPIEGSASFAHEWDQVTWHFANEEHLDAFLEDPDGYAPAFGGYCSLGVGNGYKDGMHRDAFEVIEGELYFNLTPAIHEGWLGNAEDRIATGREHWDVIKHSQDRAHIGPGISGSGLSSTPGGDSSDHDPDAESEFSRLG